ncbi:MAG TPA: helix-turn-helix domain-containing protein, partial [Pseudomonadales bacterium]|nr:helix-turn-helix domain-containing protein [Pseudomonadales bacterium]
MAEQAVSDSVQSILAAAEELFAFRGYKAASLNEVAKLAGMSKANIFHHFGSKQELYLAVLRHVCDRSSRVVESTRSETGEDMVETFRQLHRNYLASMFENS